MNLKLIFKHSVSRNAFSLSVMQLANFFVPLLVIPYLARVLSVGSFGEVMYVMALIQLSFVLTDYGFSLYAPRKIALIKRKRKLVNALIGSIFCIKIVLTLLACIIVSVLYSVSVRDFSIELILFSFLAIIAQAYQPIWLFLGIEKMKKITIYVVVSKLLYVSLVYFFVASEDDYVMVILSWSIAQLIAMLLSIYFLYKEGYSIYFSSLKRTIKVLRLSASYFWSRIAVAFYTSLNTVLLANTGTLQNVAFFGACDQVYKAGQAATNPVSQALYPYMSRKKNWSLFYKIVGGIGLLVMVGSIALLFNTEKFMELVFGTDYIEASLVLFVILIIIPINYFSVSFGYPAFGALGRLDVANLSVIVGAVVHVFFLMTLYVLNNISPLNIAIATLATEVIVLLVRFIWFYKIKNI